MQNTILPHTLTRREPFFTSYLDKRGTIQNPDYSPLYTQPTPCCSLLRENCSKISDTNATQQSYGLESASFPISYISPAFSYFKESFKIRENHFLPHGNIEHLKSTPSISGRLKYGRFLERPDNYFPSLGTTEESQNRDISTVVSSKEHDPSTCNTNFTPELKRECLFTISFLETSPHFTPWAFTVR